MEDKNKTKGWTSYPRKLWRRFVSTDIGFFFLIEFAVVLMGAITGVIIWFSKGFTTLSDGLEFARLFIAVMIAVGGAYGLILAARRSAKFSEQVDTGQKQLFNEQLGRGAELLANGEIVMRQTGIRVLGNLAERTINEPEQVKLIMQIIHDFVHSQTKHLSNDEGAEDKEAEDKGVRDKGDVELSIKTLGSLHNESGKSDGLPGFIKLLNFSLCHLERLSFSNSQLQGACFLSAKLQGARFVNAKLQGVDFRHVELQGAHFIGAKLQGAYFIGAKLQGADFIGAQLQGADCGLADFSNAKNLTKDQVKGMIFKVDAPPKLPDNLEQFLDKRRGYEFKEKPNRAPGLTCRFIESDAEWSGRKVHEYIASIRDPEDASAEWSGRLIHEWVREYITSILNPKDDG